MTLLLRYWRESLILLLIAAVILFLWLWGREKERRGVATERARVADSTLAVVKPQLARTDTLLVRDTVEVTRLLTRVRADTLWRRDTVYREGQPGFFVPTGAVAVQDSLNRACEVLKGTCAEFRDYATKTITALEAKVAAFPATRPPSVKERIMWGAGGVGVGYLGCRLTQ